MKIKSLPTLLLFVLSQITYSQTLIDKAKLDNYFETLEANNKFMGSVAVSKNGEVIYTKSIGFADVEKNMKANEHSKYRIGSISKTFTTVLVLQAVEQKKLKLDQTLEIWFPTIKNANKITLQHLLNHRSGIHNFTENETYLSWNTQPKTEKDMIDIIQKGGSDFAPDSQAEYSNSNFLLLTYILEKTYAKSYAELLETYIARPLGLTNTYVFGPINSDNQECKSYSYLLTWQPESETHFTVPLGAGAIISTPTELTKFADALFDGKLVTNESLALMKTIKDDYGIGLFQFPFYKSFGFGHTGAIDGFSSIMAHFPEEDISYALISNGNNMNMNDISIAVLSAVFDKPYDIPTFASYEVNPEDLDRYLGVYASKEIALKITITKEGNTLIAQGTGQPPLPLEATDKDKFSFEQVGANFEFFPDEHKMILFQGGGQMVFTKEE